MTSPEPLRDLTTRLLAAIDETERIAQAAADGDSGEWFVGRKWNVYRAEDETPWDDEEENRLVVYGVVRDQSEHVAHNDPAAVLRRCAADRKILAAHPYALDATDYIPSLADGEPSFFCRACHMGHRYAVAPDDWGRYCETILALAEGYDITEEAQHA